MALSAKERQQRWREKQKEKGKKSITIILSQDIFNILESEKNKQNKKMGDILEQIILEWYEVTYNVTSENPAKKEKENIENLKKAVEQLIIKTDFQQLLKDVTYNEFKEKPYKTEDFDTSKIDNESVINNENIVTENVINNDDYVQGNVTNNEEKTTYNKEEIASIINQKKQGGLSFADIADYLNQHVNTLTGKGQWHRQTVSRMFKKFNKEQDNPQITNNVINNQDIV